MNYPVKFTLLFPCSCNPAIPTDNHIGFSSVIPECLKENSSSYECVLILHFLYRVYMCVYIYTHTYINIYTHIYVFPMSLLFHLIYLEVYFHISKQRASSLIRVAHRNTISYIIMYFNILLLKDSHIILIHFTFAVTNKAVINDFTEKSICICYFSI